MIKPNRLAVGGIYKNRRNDRRQIVAIGANGVKYKVLEKNGRGPGKVGSEYVCTVDTFSRWAYVVLAG
jgi:hypothetical protein